MKTSLVELKHTVKDLQSQVEDTRRGAANEAEFAETRLRRLEGMLSKQRFARNDTKDLSDFPGIKQPKWYVVDIPFSYGDTESKRGEVVISADGAFVCTQVQSFYLITDTDIAHYDAGRGAPGRTLPTSSYRQYFGQMARNPLSLYSAYGSSTIFTFLLRNYAFNTQEFDFEIEVEGTGRYWTSGAIPGHVFGGAVEPSYLAFEGVIENSDRLVVYAHPALDQTGVTLDGKVRFVFHGYSISSKLSTKSFIKTQSE